MRGITMREHPRSWYVPQTYSALVEDENTRGKVFDILCRALDTESDIMERGVSRGAWVKNNHPKAAQARRIAEYYGLPIEDDFIDDDGEECFLLKFYATAEWRYEAAIELENRNI